MKVKNKSKIDYILGFFLGIFLFGPQKMPLYFTRFSMIDTFYDLWKLASMALTFFLLIFILSSNRKRLKPNNLMLPFLIIVYYVYCILVTLINHGSTRLQIRELINCIYICASFYIVLTWRDGGLLSGALFLFAAELFINLILLIIKPEGFFYPMTYWYRNGQYYPFLAQKNVILRMLFPGLVFALALDFIKNDKKLPRTWIYLIALIATSILANSSTSIVATIFLALSMLFWGNMKHNSKLISIRNINAAALIVFFIVIVLQIATPFSVFLTGILQKDLTFTGRTFLWNEAISYITKKPIFGYGLEDSNIQYQRFFTEYEVFDSCHNFYLDTVYRSGLVGLFIIFLIILQVDKKMNNPLINEKVRLYFILLSLIIFVSWNFEPYVGENLHNILGYFLFLYYLWEENSLIYRKCNY